MTHLFNYPKSYAPQDIRRNLCLDWKEVYRILSTRQYSGSLLSILIRELALTNSFFLAWESNDLNTVGQFFLPYVAFREPATGIYSTRPKEVKEASIKFVEKLGYGMYYKGKWKPGGCNPTITETRKALRRWVIGPNFPIISFYKFFLYSLKISPIRLVDAWKNVEFRNLFNNFEFRKDVFIDNQVHQTTMNTVKNKKERLSLDSYHGYTQIRRIK